MKQKADIENHEIDLPVPPVTPREGFEAWADVLAFTSDDDDLDGHQVNPDQIPLF